MRHLLATTVVVLATAALTWSVATSARPFPAAISQPAQAPVHVAAFADAQCRRDAAGLVANAANLTLEQAAPAIARAPRCSAVRYLGSVHMNDGVHYLFVLTDADDEYEVWWVYSVDPDTGLVTGLQ